MMRIAAALALVPLSLAMAEPGPAPKPGPAGAELFAQNCAACHQLTGRGIPGAFPALAGDKFVLGDPTRVVSVVLNGRGGMPSFRDSLPDADIAAVLSHVRSSWGNKAAPIRPVLVAQVRGGKAGAVERPIPAH